MTAFVIQELLHKVSDFVLFQQSGFNPFQALILNLISSLISIAGGAVGILVMNSFTMQVSTEKLLIYFPGSILKKNISLNAPCTLSVN